MDEQFEAGMMSLLIFLIHLFSLLLNNVFHINKKQYIRIIIN